MATASIFILKKKGASRKKGKKSLRLENLYIIGRASNGRILFSTKVFTQKPSVINTIRAIMKAVGGKSTLVQDNSLVDGAVVFKLGLTGSPKKTNNKPKKL